MNNLSFINNLLNDIELKYKNNEADTIPNFIFCGPSLYNINCIVKQICCILSGNGEKGQKYNILLVDCVFNSSIINIRNNVQQFIKSRFSKTQGFKIIIFNNLDELSDDAQCALRVLMEENNTNLFIGIASNMNNVVSPIRSRMICVYTSNQEITKMKPAIASMLFHKLKYNPKINWLYNITNKNIKNTVLLFNDIKNELLKIKNYDRIVSFFKELIHHYNVKYNTCKVFYDNRIFGDIATNINRLLVEHIIVMENIFYNI